MHRNKLNCMQSHKEILAGMHKCLEILIDMCQFFELDECRL